MQINLQSTSGVCSEYIGMQKRAKVIEEHPFERTGYVIMKDEETRIRWVKQVY